MNFINRKVEKLVFKDHGLTDASRQRKLLGVILLLGFLLRIYIAFFASLPHMIRDTVGYFQQADTLLAGGYTDFFPNGYPLIVACMKWIGGAYDIQWILFLNVVLSLFVIYFIYEIAKSLTQREDIALLAALIMAFFPSQVNYVRWLTSEIPSTFFLVGAYFFYYRDKKFWSGIFFGCGTIIRSEILPIFLLLMLFEFIFKKKVSLLFLAGLLLPVLMMGSYCYIKTGKFSVAGHGFINILYSVTASGSYIDWNYPDKHPDANSTGKALTLYFDQFKTAPLQFIYNRFANLWELWGFFPSSSNGNRGLLSRLVIGFSNLFLLGFGLPAWWKGRRNFNVFIFIIPFVVVTAIHFILLAAPRYTYPVEPFLILLASWTLARVLQKSRS